MLLVSKVFEKEASNGRMFKVATFVEYVEVNNFLTGAVEYSPSSKPATTRIIFDNCGFFANIEENFITNGSIEVFKQGVPYTREDGTTGLRRNFVVFPGEDVTDVALSSSRSATPNEQVEANEDFDAPQNTAELED